MYMYISAYALHFYKLSSAVAKKHIKCTAGAAHVTQSLGGIIQAHAADRRCTTSYRYIIKIQIARILCAWIKSRILTYICMCVCVNSRYKIEDHNAMAIAQSTAANMRSMPCSCQPKTTNHLPYCACSKSWHIYKHKYQHTYRDKCL